MKIPNTPLLQRGDAEVVLLTGLILLRAASNWEGKTCVLETPGAGTGTTSVHTGLVRGTDLGSSALKTLSHQMLRVVTGVT